MSEELDRHGGHAGSEPKRWCGLTRLATGGAVLGCAVLLGACPNAGEDLVLSVPGTALVGGVVYLDLDGNREPGGPDLGLAGVRVRLVVAGTGDTAASASSDANGVLSFGAVPVGRFTVVVPGEASFADTIAVVRVDTADLVLASRDTVQVTVAVSFPVVTVAAARGLPLGSKVFVEGVVLSGRTVFGDTTAHVVGASAAVRVTNARGPLTASGDSVRVLGRVRSRDGQPVLDEGVFTILALVGPRVAERVTTAVASAADGGRLDAALARIVDATVLDTMTVAGDYLATVDDGSGSIAVVFDQDAGLTRTPYVPGVLIDAIGVLVPTGTGVWRLKPRVNADVVLK